MTDWLARAASARPDHPALIAPDARTWTFAEWDRAVNGVGARLAAWGAGTGARIAVLMPNRVEYALIALAVMRLGATLIPLNARLTLDELRYQVETVRPTLLIDAPETETHGRALYAAINTARVDFSGFRSCHFDPVPLNLEAAAAILFTSGTTGRPKGAQITFGNIAASARASAQRLGVEPDDRWLLTLPLYHIGGLSIVYRAALYGTTIVLDEGAFDPTRIIRALHDHRITQISLVPTQLHRLLDAGFIAPPHLRLILLGGAAASPDLLRRAFDADLPIAPTYGMTETASQIATLPPADARAKRGSVGAPLDGMHARIIDAHGRALPHGEIGEIAVRGAMVMRGYVGQPEIAPEDEFRTGDLGYLDADGDLWLVQRRSDLIITGGENVYPAEVEAVLRAHPAIADACVVGVPDTEWGQIVAAALIVQPEAKITTDEIGAHCRAHLAGYKRPRRIIFVDTLPQTASGKVIRREVVELFATSPQ
jgi:O-succinylbenzoic acid--CoA ligase